MVAGTTFSADIPNVAGQTISGTPAGFNSKFNSDLASLFDVAFIQGAILHAMAFNNNGHLFMAGETQDRNFPTTDGAYSDGAPPNGHESDVFISKFNG